MADREPAGLTGWIDRYKELAGETEFPGRARAFRVVLDEFERAVRAHAFRGAQTDRELIDAIEAEYLETREDVLAWLAKAIR